MGLLLVKQACSIVLLFQASIIAGFLSQPSIVRSNRGSMGNLFSFLNQKSTAVADEPTKEQRTAAFKIKVEEFESKVLDPKLYSKQPVRASTIEAADEYPGLGEKTLMPGSHKHLGGAYDPADGCIYGVPATAKAVLVLYPINKNVDDPKETDVCKRKVDITKVQSGEIDKSSIDYAMTSIPLPESIASTQFKWLRGIFSNGYMYAIPAWANAILCVDVDAFWGRRENDGEVIRLIPLPDEHPKYMRWQWHGAGINKEKTAIYCIPSNAQQVLKLDLSNNATSLLDIEYDKEKYPNFRIDIGNKWYGGILGVDNAIYGMPYRSCAVLRIDTTNDKVTLIGSDYGLSAFNWHGGIAVGGKIYAHPSHADYSVLVVDTNKGGECYELPIERGSDDKDTRTNYKWLGGSMGADGNIYCPACDVSSALKIDPTTGKCTTFGYAGSLKNKWQGGLLANDGCVYCIPASGLHVLRIATVEGIPDGQNALQLLGDLPQHKDKWQGGHVGLDGNLYFIPENGYRVLKVTTPQTHVTLQNGKLPEGDVKIEML